MSLPARLPADVSSKECIKKGREGWQGPGADRRSRRKDKTRNVTRLLANVKLQLRPSFPNISGPCITLAVYHYATAIILFTRGIKAQAQMVSAKSGPDKVWSMV